MFARKGLFSSIGRTTALATVAALALTAVQPSLAVAGPAKKTGLTAATGTSDATDFSSRRRYYRGGGGAAAAAAFAGIVGTGIAIAAANSRRDYYDLLRLLRRWPGLLWWPGLLRRPGLLMAAARITAIAATAPACPIIRGIPSQAGNHNSKDHSAGRLWPAEYRLVRQCVNTLATAFD